MFQSVFFVAACIALTVFVPFLRRRIKLRLLRHVPGPKPASFLRGMSLHIRSRGIYAHSTLIGVSQQMHGPISVPWREHVLTSYGRVVKIPMLLGV